jgi:hypothetical protein
MSVPENVQTANGNGATSDLGLGEVLRNCADLRRSDALRSISGYLQSRAETPFGIAATRIAAVQRTVDEWVGRENALAAASPDAMLVAVFVHDPARVPRQGYTVDVRGGLPPVSVGQTTTDETGWTVYALGAAQWGPVFAKSLVFIDVRDPTGRPLTLTDQTFTFTAGTAAIFDVWA